MDYSGCIPFIRLLRKSPMKSSWLIIFVFLIAGGCRFFKGDPYRNTPTTGKSSIGVDETLRPVVEAELDVFNIIYGYTELEARYVPENESFRQLMNGEVNLIFTSRPLTINEWEVLKQKKIFPRQTKVAMDGIALIVSPSCTDTLISIDQIRSILTGKIKRWEEINPLSTSGKIKVVFDNEKSGIVKFLADSVCKGNFDASIVSALEYNREVVEYTATHPGVLGFIGSGWISNPNDSLHLSLHRKVGIVAVSNDPLPNAENSYKPYQAFLVNGLYPLTRDIYMINTEPRNGLATGFSSFVISDKGQRIILKSGILPAIAPERVINIRNDF